MERGVQSWRGRHSNSSAAGMVTAMLASGVLTGPFARLIPPIEQDTHIRQFEWFTLQTVHPQSFHHTGQKAKRREKVNISPSDFFYTHTKRNANMSIKIRFASVVWGSICRTGVESMESTTSSKKNKNRSHWVHSKNEVLQPLYQLLLHAYYLNC